MRTKKIFLNMITDIIPYILIGIIGLVKVRFLIYYIGDIGNGYYQTINQIITYIFLAQIGFGDAVIYSLYKYFAKENKREINRIYTGSRKIFKKIGYVILGIIFIVSILLYFFYGFEDGYKNTSLIAFIIISCSYLIAYFGCGQTYLAILSASENKYIYSLVFNSIKLLCDILIILVCYKFSTLESIAITILICKIIEEIIIRIVMKHKFPWLKKVKNANVKMFNMTKDLASIQISNLILNNVDLIIIMKFLGPVYVSIYSSYIFITRYLNEISNKIELSVVNSFGNLFASTDKKEIYPLYKQLLVLFTILSFSMIITFTLGIRPFINLWIGKDNYILSYYTVILFSLSSFFYIISLPLLSLINSNGLFKDNKIIINICMFTNIILSLILVNYFSLNGLLIATSISFLINIILKLIIVNKKVLNNNIYIPYIFIIISMLLILFIIKPIEYIFYSYISNIITLIIILIILFISLVLFIFGLLSLINNDSRNLYIRIVNLIKK